MRKISEYKNRKVYKVKSIFFGLIGIFFVKRGVVYFSLRNIQKRGIRFG